MNKVKVALLSIMAFAAKKAALSAAGAASYVDYHQPKEPVNLHEMLKK